MNMNETTRKKLIFAILIGSIILAIIMRPWESGRDHRGQSDHGEQQQASELSAHAAVVTQSPGLRQGPTTVAQPVEFAESWPDNPFFDPHSAQTAATVAPAGASSQTEQLRLQGILSSGGQRACVINGLTYPTGGTIQNWRVVEIGDHSVMLRRGSRTLRLTLPDPRLTQGS